MKVALTVRVKMAKALCRTIPYDLRIMVDKVSNGASGFPEIATRPHGAACGQV